MVIGLIFDPKYLLLIECLLSFGLLLQVTIEHATLASISYHGYYKKVDVQTPSGTFTALLVQEGCDAPTDVASVNTTITIPVTAVGVTDTSTLPFVEQLGERPSIKAVGSSAAYITSNCIHRQLDTNETIVAYANWAYDTAAAKSAGVDGASTVTLAGRYASAGVAAAGMNMIPMQEPYEPSSLVRPFRILFLLFFFLRGLLFAPSHLPVPHLPHFSKLLNVVVH